LRKLWKRYAACDAPKSKKARFDEKIDELDEENYAHERAVTAPRTALVAPVIEKDGNF
jgi:hypothetical protein